jgi:ribosomal protein L21E
LKKEADTRMIDLRLLIDERRSGAFRCVGCGKPMVMRELFANGDRVYQCLNGDCVKRIIRYQYQGSTGRIAEVA